MIKSTRLRSTLSASTILAAGLLLVVAPAQAQNLPDTGNVSVSTRGLSGGAPGSTDPGFVTSGAAGAQTLRVDLKDNRTILNWGGTGFNVAAGNTVDFKDARATAGVTGRTDNIAVLNRDLSGNTSNILGTIKSDPNVAVYLINQSGILFGSNAVVNTGAFFAGTSNLSDDNDFLNAATRLRFSGSSGGTITANAGSQFTTAASASSNGGRMGDLVMMGSQVLFRGTVGNATSGGAAGDIALIAASDAAITNTPGSPLSIQIYSGTSLWNGIEVGSGSTLRGRNVVLAYAQSTFAPGPDYSMAIFGNLIATGATVTDRGVVLSSGIGTGNVNIDLNATSGYGSINQTGNIDSASGLLSNAITHSIDGVVNAAGAIDFGGAFVNSVSSADTITGARVTFGQIVGLAGKVTATAGDIISKSQTYFEGGVEATGDVIIDGSVPGFMLGAPGAKIGGALKVNAFAVVELDGAVTAGSVDIKAGVDLQILNSITATGPVKLSAGNATTTGNAMISGTISAGNDDIDIEANGDLTVNLSGQAFTARNLVSGGAMNLTADKIVVGQNFGTSVGPGGINATGDLTIDAATSLLVLGETKGRSITITQTNTAPTAFVQLYSKATSSTGDIKIDAGAGIETADLSSAGIIKLRAGAYLVGANLAAATGIDLGAATVRAATANAAHGDIVATGNDVTFSNANAFDGNIEMTSQTGGVTLGGLISNSFYSGGNSSASGNIILTADGGVAAIRGNVTVGGALIATARDRVDIGNLDGVASTIKAKGAISLTASAGSISSNSGLTLLGNSDGLGAEPITLDAGYIDVGLGGSVRAGPNRESDIKIVLRDSPQSPQSISLWNTSAHSLSAVSFTTTPVQGIDHDATVSLGGDTFTNGLYLDVRSLVIAGALTVTNGGIDITTRTTDPMTGISIRGAISATGDIIARSNSLVRLDAGASFTGSNVVLSAASAFTNNAGGSVMHPSGHWVIYSADPSLDTFGGLDSGNTALWSSTLATRDPSMITGNRYVFALRPTLTISAQDISKIYGDTPSGNVVPWTVTGYRGVAGAFLIDTAATAFTGAPSFTSAGFAQRASVAGGPYAILGGTGSLQSAAGYAFSFAPGGTVTVTPKQLTGVATAGNKTYDGTTAGTGYVTLNGVIGGDAVWTTGTTFTFSDKNAGTGKTVNVAGATLTGADAGNYTLTMPASVLANILKKAIGASVIANDKTYDGTTAGSGTVTLNGMIAGDNVTTSGTTFTFSDKNAGTGKTVTVAGTIIGGADAGNYVIHLPASALADILKKAITASVTVDSKTYDGDTNATGSVMLNGVVSGDAVTTSGTTFTFADKSAATGKMVAVGGTTIGGADAGNYSITIPASALGDILKKAVTASVAVDNKTYDGTTLGTGTVTLNGLVAGDQVGTSGTTFTFGDKNAGIGKTVAVGGTTLTGGDAGNYTLTIPASALADILKKALTANVTADTKTYDGTALGTGTVTLNGVISGDAVGTSGTNFTFSDKNAGSGKTVAVAGTTLTGADAGNYTLTVPASAFADILKKALTANVIANNKTYDGTAAGTGTVTLNGVVSGDTVGTSGTSFTFADRNAGAAKTVTVAGTTLTGTDAGNYTLTVPASVLADILKKAITASVVANTKTYDGTTAGTGTVTLNGVVSGDAVGTAGTTFTFADKNAGTGKTVTVAGTTLTGADAGNYTVTVPAAALADILRKAITASVVANNKTYDGTATGTGTVTLNGVVAGDAVGTNGTTFTFSDKNAGTGKTVTVAGTALTGTDAGNYTVTVPASALADILKKSLTASVVAGNKTYDGTTSGTGTITLNGVVSGDTVGTSGTTFTFADKNAGAGKTVNVAGTTLTGADAGNYTVTVPASALADILKKAITASVAVTSKTYDGTTAGTGTVTVNGVVSGDNVTTSGTTFTYADKNAGTGKAVAVAGTTIGGADAGNYTITIPASALGDILRRALSVTADDASKVQNDPDPALTYTLTSGSLVSGDAFSGNLARDTGENPGTYAIKIGTLNAGDNYTITFTPGTFTINLPLGSEGLQPALKAQPLPSQIGTGASSGSSVNLDTSAVCGDDKNCTTGNPTK
ncbi:YDG domain-containing protein [Sphingomonas asaccharolytica]|uniref:YDG domain-containing protein n=1 Tax=Sphingomonas asaccharolytica TaxID=40681 RepID=UPI0008360656|nr:YDG domain-containing protein [Sphingomonas asaccharolytica]